MKLKKIWADYNLSIVLCILFIVAWYLQTLAGWYDFVGEHGTNARFWGPNGYIWKWLAATMENWQSEFLQLLTFVVLTAYFVHKGSHESKDTDERFERALKRIEKMLAEQNAILQSDSKSRYRKSRVPG